VGWEFNIFEDTSVLVLVGGILAEVFGASGGWSADLQKVEHLRLLCVVMRTLEDYGFLAIRNHVVDLWL
jgi:hypothetical protein